MKQATDIFPKMRVFVAAKGDFYEKHLTSSVSICILCKK